MKSKQTYKLIGFLVIAMLFMISKETFAAPAEVNMPSLNISFDGSETPADYPRCCIQFEQGFRPRSGKSLCSFCFRPLVFLRKRSIFRTRAVYPRTEHFPFSVLPYKSGRAGLALPLSARKIVTS